MMTNSRAAWPPPATWNGFEAMLLRSSLKMTQEDFAGQLGISARFLRSIEKAGADFKFTSPAQRHMLDLMLMAEQEARKLDRIRINSGESV